MGTKRDTAANAAGAPDLRGHFIKPAAGESLGLGSASGTRRKMYLYPGQLFASVEPRVVTTILGSCVSLCLWDPVTMIGGMNHYLLPSFAGNAVESPRFGTVAIEGLVAQVISLGAAKKRLRAKLFGGACVIEAFQEKADHIGIVNAQFAEATLRTLAIPVVEQDLGGRRGRKLMFNTDDGESWVKYL